MAAPSKELLAAYARHGIVGTRVQRQRLLEADAPNPIDLDFYVHAAWLLRESARMARDRLGLNELVAPIEDLDRQIPNLKDYRDEITHALSERFAYPVARFGEFVTLLKPGGAVEYLVDARDDQRALEQFFERLVAVLDPDSEWTAHVLDNRPDLDVPAPRVKHWNLSE